MLGTRGIAVACRLCLPLLFASCTTTLHEHLHFYSADREGDFDDRLLASRGFEQYGPVPSLGLTWDFDGAPQSARGLTREALHALLVVFREQTDSGPATEGGALRAWLSIELPEPLQVEASSAAEAGAETGGEERPPAQPPPEIVAEEAQRASAPPATDPGQGKG